MNESVKFIKSKQSSLNILNDNNQPLDLDQINTINNTNNNNIIENPNCQDQPFSSKQTDDEIELNEDSAPEDINETDSIRKKRDMLLIDNSKKRRKRVVNLLTRNPIQHSYVSSGIGKASFVHALIVIFLEFFAWGLLTDQVITVLNETFPENTFLANGLIHGLKGILSFLSAPLLGALSDVWGRKVFLLITVFFTCLPIPLMRINPMWYFAMISISGLFAVTFSVVFAYVADVTDESNRTTAYGLVSATFAASLITSPALGSYLSRFYSENFVIALATAIAVFDLFFIMVAVPESLPEKLRERSKTITWENVDPFKALKSIFADKTITLLCITVFLSYLPEAGQYSCFFVYLKLIVGFSQNQVAYFIAFVGILSCIAQAAILIVLIKYFGSRQSIIIGLSFQVLQLAMYAFAAQQWLIWFSGLLAAISSIGYPAISAYISNHSHVDQQGVSQGMVTGIRGLCNGIGPAMYGFVFWIFRVNLNEASSANNSQAGHIDANEPKATYASTHILPGPPFLFGSVLALIAIFVTWLIPPNHKPPSILVSAGATTSALANSTKYNKENTLVKIGNTSNTYNRTSSSSSIAQQATSQIQNDQNLNETLLLTAQKSGSLTGANYLNNDLISSSLTFNSNKNFEENQNLLMKEFYYDESENNSLTTSASLLAAHLPTTVHAHHNLNTNSSKNINNQLLNTIGGIINQSYSVSSSNVNENHENNTVSNMSKSLSKQPFSSHLYNQIENNNSNLNNNFSINKQQQTQQPKIKLDNNLIVNNLSSIQASSKGGSTNGTHSSHSNSSFGLINNTVNNLSTLPSSLSLTTTLASSFSLSNAKYLNNIQNKTNLD